MMSPFLTHGMLAAPAVRNMIMVMMMTMTRRRRWWWCS